MKFEREQSAGYVINLLARRYARALQRRIEPEGCTIGQFPFLLLLWEEDELSPSEISRRIDIEQATVTNTLKRMERDGLIERRSDPNDGRRAVVVITEKGTSLRDILLNHAMAVNNLAATDIDPEKMEVFMEVAAKMNLNLE